jgi:hypothetical protein
MAEKTVVQLEVAYGAKSPSAFTARNIRRMYERLERMGKGDAERIATRMENGRKYDVFQCKDGSEVWFDITEYFEELMRLVDAARKASLN